MNLIILFFTFLYEKLQFKVVVFFFFYYRYAHMTSSQLFKRQYKILSAAHYPCKGFLSQL
jgi:hypothetical protein